MVRRLEREVAPRWEVIRPGLVVLPSAGAARYFGGEEHLARRIKDTAAAAGFTAHVGGADTVFAAALAARREELVPAGHTSAWLAPFGVGVLGHPMLTGLLPRLGVRTLGDFAALPVEKVLARFGAAGVAAQRTARGLEARPLATRTPGEDLITAHVFEPPESRLEAVAFVAKALAQALHERLAAAGAVCARVEVGVDLADGRRLSRLWRHEGGLSELAIAERVRWQLTAWAEAGTLDTAGDAHDAAGAGAVAGIARLALRPEELSAAAGRQGLLFGRRSASAEMEAAAARLQAMLGHAGVLRVELGGGRGPAERVVQIPFGDLPPDDGRRRPAAGPWPGRLPAPHPAWVPDRPQPADLAGTDGTPIGISARLELSAPPARLAVGGSEPVGIEAWAGPWPALEEWWEAQRARRLVRMQVVTSTGAAWLLLCEAGQWWAEGLYG